MNGITDYDKIIEPQRRLVIFRVPSSNNLPHGASNALGRTAAAQCCAILYAQVQVMIMITSIPRSTEPASPPDLPSLSPPACPRTNTTEPTLLAC